MHCVFPSASIERERGRQRGSLSLSHSGPALPRRRWSILAIWVVGAALISPPAGAGPRRPIVMQTEQGSRQICIGTVSGEAGMVTNVPITLNEGDSVASFQIDVLYDPTKMTPVRALSGADTAAAGWSVDSQLLEEGSFRVLAFSAVAVGLGPGPKELALVEFDIAPGRQASGVPLGLENCILGDPGASAIPCEICPQPGLDLATPRFGMSFVGEALGFQPSQVIVERGDWVLWTNTGSTTSHTSTSGAACSPDGLWDGYLPPATRFARQFVEPPGTLLFYCGPHCLQAETGEVQITSTIDLQITILPGAAQLSWTGGSGSYRVHRSDDAAFIGVQTVTLGPDGGPNGTTLLETPEPSTGSAFFYIVTNLY